MEVQDLLKHTLLNSANTELVGRFKNLHKFLTTFLLKKKYQINLILKGEMTRMFNAIVQLNIP